MDSTHLHRRWRWLLAVMLLGLGHASATARETPYLVIVHPQNLTPALDRAAVTRFFMRKTTRWPDGRTVRPVDLPTDSPVRQSFAEDLLGRTAVAVRAYWQQAIFSGRAVPPPELPNDDAVIDYVLANEGAIGYVSRAASLRHTRVLLVK
jgi:hypothetical protein